MKTRKLGEMKTFVILLALLFLLAGCAENITETANPSNATETNPVAQEIELAQDGADVKNGDVRPGTETDRGFVLDNVLDDDELGEIHFHLFVPESYDGTKDYALHIALPGWEGMYFQGVGEDLRWEYLPFESRNYIEDMIAVSFQYNGRGTTAARQVVRLTEYMLSSYRISEDRVYITGYSLGGDILSHVMELRPDMFRRALFVSSRWDGDPKPLTDARVPLYLFTSAHDSYYSAEPARDAWQSIHDLYVSSGLTEEEISELLVLDVREDAWFDEVMASDAERTGSQYATDYHGAGMLVAFDESVMAWVFQ